MRHPPIPRPRFRFAPPIPVPPMPARLVRPIQLSELERVARCYLDEWYWHSHLKAIAREERP